MTENRARSAADSRALDSLKAVAFDLIPEPAMVVDRDVACDAEDPTVEAGLTPFEAMDGGHGARHGLADPVVGMLGSDAADEIGP